MIKQLFWLAGIFSSTWKKVIEMPADLPLPEQCKDHWYGKPILRNPRWAYSPTAWARRSKAITNQQINGTTKPLTQQQEDKIILEMAEYYGYGHDD